MMVIDEDSAMFSGRGDGSDDFSQQHWQDKTAAVADDYIKLKYQLETAMRDKERDANTISSLKHVRGNNHPLATSVVLYYIQTLIIAFLLLQCDKIFRKLGASQAEWLLQL